MEKHKVSQFCLSMSVTESVKFKERKVEGSNPALDNWTWLVNFLI